MYNSVRPLKKSKKCLDLSVIFDTTMQEDDTCAHSDDGLLEKVYECLENGVSLDTLHIPHSDVFFVREALEERFKCSLSLEQVEEYMYEAGWSEHGST